MPRSMTGFARQEAELDWGALTWEIRSVNHRYLEPHFRLPDSVRALETDLRDQLRKRLGRGKLECALFVQFNQSGAEELSIDHTLVTQLANVIGQVDDHLTHSTPVSALDLLKWPGVLQKSELDRDVLLATALEQFNAALDQLIENREREGAELAQLIEQRLVGITEQVSTVRAAMPAILNAQRDKLTAKLESLVTELDPERLEQEVVLLAQKADVDEELDRLDTHVVEVRRCLKDKKPIGRRLDFLMQELNREANTLSSKAVVSDTTAAAVELKVLIEQMREQIQNIE